MFLNVSDLLTDEMVLAIKSVPENETHIDLSGNELNLRTGTDLAAGLSAISTNINSLDLTNNELGHQSVSQLNKAFPGIPTTVIDLNLRMNKLYLQKNAKLGQVFRSLHRELQSISLADNELNRLAKDDLISGFISLPLIRTIDLSCNKLGMKSATDLSEILQALPASISSLDFGYNELGQKTIEELAVIFGGLQDKNVTFIDMSGNKFEAKSTRELTDFINILPKSVKEIMISPQKTIRINQVVTSELEAQGFFAHASTAGDLNAISKEFTI